MLPFVWDGHDSATAVTESSVMLPQFESLGFVSDGHDFATAVTESSVMFSQPSSLTVVSDGHDFATAVTDSSVISMQKERSSVVSDGVGDVFATIEVERRRFRHRRDDAQRRLLRQVHRRDGHSDGEIVPVANNTRTLFL